MNTGILKSSLSLVVSLTICACKPDPESSVTGQAVAVENVSVDMKSRAGNDMSLEMQNAIGEPLQMENQEALAVSFCGIRTLQGMQEFKLFDWETEGEAWVKVGDSYRGFDVVGFDQNQNSLVLESRGYWFLHPLENLAREGNQSKQIHVIQVSDVPKGVELMEYVTNHAQPLNPPSMPENMEVLNPHVEMPSE